MFSSSTTLAIRIFSLVELVLKVFVPVDQTRGRNTSAKWLLPEPLLKGNRASGNEIVLHLS